MSAEYPGARWAPSPNFTPGRDEAVDTIVAHHTDGQPRTDRAVEHLQKSRADYQAEGRDRSPVSAHFLIGQDGEIVQLVRLQDTAWHCSGWNGRSIGIEHIARTPGELGPEDPGLPLTPAQLDASAALVAWLRRRHALPMSAVKPHCANPKTTHRDCGRDVLDGGIWPWAEYLRRIELLDPAGAP
mgnify:CR=1 FL=1